MAIRDIRLLGDPVLRQKAEPLDGLDAETRRLIADMFDTMYEADGVGLAAPQVGIGHRVIVVDPRDEHVKPFALINPVILDFGRELDRGEEGCLSIPGVKDIVERPSTVLVQGLDGEGNPTHIAAEGLLARVLQHEIDHLDGILFFDRLSPLKRKMLLSKWQKVKPEPKVS
ncbi:MAG TPA: peptide deformylase [Longimicrobiales bacterium]|nr:peptide deformylase [Longimicrobiales bacterium]